MSSPTDESDALLELLRRWRAGDRSALDQLLTDIQPWLHREVSRAMAGRARTTQDSMDLAQTAIVNLLAWGPPFVPESVAQFRALLRRIASNELIDHERRGARSSRMRSSESLGESRPPLAIEPLAPTSLRPSAALARSEESAWVRLALQFLEPEERTLLLASEVEGTDWAAIAAELGLASADAARMQCARLKPRVARLLLQLRRGRTPETP